MSKQEPSYRLGITVFIVFILPLIVVLLTFGALSLLMYADTEWLHWSE